MSLSDAIISGDRKAARQLARLLTRVGEAFGRRGVGGGANVVKYVAAGGSVARFRWKSWAVAYSHRFGSSSHRSRQSPWESKCDVFCKSLRLRWLDAAPKRTRESLWVYSTSDWTSATVRMLYNLNRNTWRGRVDPWKRWTMTVAKNHNRRRENRNGTGRGETYNDQGGTTDGGAQSAELPMRLLGP